MTAPRSPDADSVVADIALRHGLSCEAVLAMLHALQVGGGAMAQFDIPELGGSGQWMHGGMTMVGNMFDNALKARVDALCAELSQLLASSDAFPARPGGSVSDWWPSDLGVPSATGGQNDARYAVFPGTRRLAIQNNGGTRVFGTGDHRIGGVQQQQGGRAGVVTFTSQLGTFDVSSLTEVGARQAPETSVAAPAQPPASAPGDAGAIIAAIEALAGLHERGILSDAEFSAKKAELLGRI